MTHTTKNVPEDRVIYVMAWTEIELGWGERPDGYTIHPSQEAFQKFANELEVKRIAQGWREFSKPDWREARRIYIEPGSDIEKGIEALTEGQIKSSESGTLWLHGTDALKKAVQEHLRRS